MSTTALQGLLEYLYGTLSPKNMRWVADHLMERAEQAEPEALRRYTMDEIDAMLDRAEAEIAAGKGTSHEESMREWEDEIARMEQEEYEVAEAV